MGVSLACGGLDAGLVTQGVGATNVDSNVQAIIRNKLVTNTISGNPGLFLLIRGISVRLARPQYIPTPRGSQNGAAPEP
jgi:hypothetical protein